VAAGTLLDVSSNQFIDRIFPQKDTGFWRVMGNSLGKIALMPQNTSNLIFP
jgi:hypothetical protein